MPLRTSSRPPSEDSAARTPPRRATTRSPMPTFKRMHPLSTAGAMKSFFLTHKAHRGPSFPSEKDPPFPPSKGGRSPQRDPTFLHSSAGPLAWLRPNSLTGSWGGVHPGRLNAYAFDALLRRSRSRAKLFTSAALYAERRFRLQRTRVWLCGGRQRRGRLHTIPYAPMRFVRPHQRMHRAPSAATRVPFSLLR